MATVLATLANYVTALWITATVLLRLTRDRNRAGALVEVARVVWAEVRPFFLLAVAIVAVDNLLGERPGGYAFGLVILAAHLYCWFAYKDVDDDDRWKRRARRAAERVAQAGARLRVVPAPAAGGA